MTAATALQAGPRARCRMLWATPGYTLRLPSLPCLGLWLWLCLWLAAGGWGWGPGAGRGCPAQGFCLSVCLSACLSGHISRAEVIGPNGQMGFLAIVPPGAAIPTMLPLPSLPFGPAIAKALRRQLRSNFRVRATRASRCSTGRHEQRQVSNKHEDTHNLNQTIHLHRQEMRPPTHTQKQKHINCGSTPFET